MRRRRGRTHPTAVTVAALGLVADLVAVSCGDEGARPTEVVSVFGTLSDADVDDVVAGMAAFERDTGIDVRYVGSSSFESDLLERLRRGDPPDLRSPARIAVQRACPRP